MWEPLVEKYAPRSTPSHYNRTFSSLNHWTRNKIGLITYMSDDGFMLLVMGYLSKECEATLTDLKNRLMAKRDKKLSIEMMQVMLNGRYEGMEQNEKKNPRRKGIVCDAAEGKRESMAAWNDKHFNGIWRTCRRWGHKVDNYLDKKNSWERNSNARNKNNNSNDIQCRFIGKHHYCDKVDHRIKECHSKKAVDKKANATVDEKNDEQVELTFDCVGDNHVEMCRFMVKPFLFLPRTHGLVTLEHPATSLTMMVACLCKSNQ